MPLDGIVGLLCAGKSIDPISVMPSLVVMVASSASTMEVLITETSKESLNGKSAGSAAWRAAP
ncbi:MAG: hypothetical protein E5X24_23640, partial [Mesorhizobium sp.]